MRVNGTFVLSGLAQSSRTLDDERTWRSERFEEGVRRGWERPEDVRRRRKGKAPWTSSAPVPSAELVAGTDKNPSSASLSLYLYHREPCRALQSRLYGATPQPLGILGGEPL